MQWNNANPNNVLAWNALGITGEQGNEASTAERMHSQLLFFRQWFEFAPDAYLATDLQGVISEANYAAAALLNVAKEFIIGKPLGLLLADDYHSAFYTRLMRLREGDSVDWWDVKLSRSADAPRHIRISAAPLPDRTGHPSQVRWMLRDVTPLRQAQDQVLRTERLATIGQMSAGLAHEGRNALQRIQACLSVLMLRLQDQPETLEMLQRIERAQDDLRHLFDDLRSYAVDPHLHPQCSDVRLAWREAWKDLGDVLENKQAELREEVLDADPFVFVDPFYLKNVFRNLLENALTCGADPVRIVVRCRPAPPNGRKALRISVRDNGPGIAQEQRQHLFEPFFTTKTRGTGLGLAICKRIIEAHDGRIDVDSQIGSGTTIHLTLPRRPS